MLKPIVTLILASSLTFNCFAKPTPEQISESVVGFIKQQIGDTNEQKIKIKPENLNTRTQIPECKQFEYSLPAGKVKRNTTVLITCAELTNWRLYVPTRVTWLAPVVTLTQQAAPGDILGPHNLSVELKDETKVRASNFTDISPLVGAKLKRRLSKGNAVSSRDICLVCKNDQVTIHARINGLSLTTEGTALSSGTLNDTILVRNNQSQRKISGQVDGVGSVSVKM